MEGDQNEAMDGVMGNNPPAGSNPNPTPTPAPATAPVSQPENIEIKTESTVGQVTTPTPAPSPTPTPAPAPAPAPTPTPQSAAPVPVQNPAFVVPTPTPTPAPVQNQIPVPATPSQPVANATPSFVPTSAAAVMAEKLPAHKISGDEVPTPTELNRKPFIIVAIIVLGLLAVWFWYIFGNNKPNVWPDASDVKITVDDSQEQGEVNIVGGSDQAITTTTGSGNDQALVSGETIRITAYYSNGKKGSNDNCGLVFPLQRDVEKKYGSDIINTVRGLLTPLTDAERQAGWSSNVPVGTHLKSVVVKNGVAEVNFNSQLNKIAGSCAVTALRAQIEKTVLQFPYVTSVLICVDGNCNQTEILQP